MAAAESHTLAEVARKLLGSELSPEAVAQLGVSPGSTVGDALVLGLANRALRGDATAASLVLELGGAVPDLDAGCEDELSRALRELAESWEASVSSSCDLSESV